MAALSGGGEGDRGGEELKVEIVGHEVVDQDHARFVLVITAPARRWKVRRRFKEFFRLYDTLVGVWGAGLTPAPPQKKFFLLSSSKFDRRFLMERGIQLQGFVRDVLRRPGAADEEAEQQFLDLNEFAMDAGAAENLRMMFDVLDERGEGGGRLDKEQVGMAVEMMGVSPTEALLTALMAELDDDRDGYVQFEEFKGIDRVFELQEQHDEKGPADDAGVLVTFESYSELADGSAAADGPGSSAAPCLTPMDGVESVVLYTSSTNFSILSEAEERRLKHILNVRKVRYEIVYLDITVDRREELNEAIRRTQRAEMDGEILESEGKKSNLMAPIPRLVVHGYDIGGYADVQMLEDDGAFAQILQNCPKGESFWTPPDDWKDDGGVDAADHLEKVVERLEAEEQSSPSSIRRRGLTRSATMRAMNVLGVSERDMDTMDDVKEQGAGGGDATIAYDDFLNWFEKRSASKKHFEQFLDESGAGVLEREDIAEASRVLGHELGEAEIAKLVDDLGIEDSVDVMEFISWWGSHITERARA